MELSKRYMATMLTGVVALVCVLVGPLGVTVLRPPTHQVSSAVSSTDLIVTHDNILLIVKDDATVTATLKPGVPMTLNTGTTQDVKDWIGGAAYTEVISVKSDRAELKAKSRDMIGPSRVPSPTPAQSDAQSGVQSGAQPLTEPSSADLIQQLASSDVRSKQASGEGAASLKLGNVPSGRPAFAVSAAGPNNLTLTLTWKVEQTNTLAIIMFLAAYIFALTALALLFTRWRLLRLHKIHEARIEERCKADSLETSSINSAAVARRIAAACEAVPATVVVSEPAKTGESSVEGSKQREAGADDQYADNVPTWGTTTFVPGRNEVKDDEAPVAETDEMVTGDSTEAEPADETPMGPAEASDDNAERAQPIVGIPEEYVPDPLTDTFERRGRHDLDNGLIGQDPPKRAATDTGVIDLSGIRGGHILPSRRALRETRNSGEQVVVVDGQESNTDLIPVTYPRATEQASMLTAAPDDDASSTGGQTSIMPGRLKDRQEDK